MKVVLASKNKHKVVEISRIMEKLDIQLVLQSDLGVDIDVEETGTTFEENSFQKAEAVMKATGLPALADDSGIAVDALNGEPGIYSARYMGEDTSYRIKNANLVERLNGVPDEKRTARFVCAISAALPGGTILRSRGTIEGRIGYEERGENGFGYDPIFYLPEYGCSTAELDPATKNRLSHRGKALEAIKEQLRPFLEEGNR